MNCKVIELKAERDLAWPFEEEQPRFLFRQGSSNRSEKVDPFPSYAHDLALTTLEMEKASAAFPIPQSVFLYVLDRESLTRTNGHTMHNTNYDGPLDKNGNYTEWNAAIVLSGKRIPPHPAMTRYLVSHEYGHVIAASIWHKRGFNDEWPLYQEYAALRKFETAKHYGGGTWHKSIEELFANDFRILVAKSELEFWPHPGFPRPEDIPEIVAFWDSQTAAIRETV